jgi:diguanylate cyclase (GGDEF)-like protein
MTLPPPPPALAPGAAPPRGRRRAWSDLLLPAALRADDDVLHRARLTVLLSIVLIGAALSYALFYSAVMGFMEAAVVLSAGASVAAGALALLQLRPWLHAVGHVLTCVLYAVLVALVCLEGGLASLATPWLLTPPIFAVLLLGRRDAVVWTAVCVLTIAALFALEARGIRFPVRYPPEWAARLTLGSHAGLVVCTAILIFVFEDIRAAAQARAEAASAALARLAYHDVVTGLPNRARFLECLEGALARARAGGDEARVAVLLLDLDGFKQVNDSLGHAAGDALLAEVAARLRCATRGCDTVARLGGDEFAVLLDGARRDADAAVVAQRIVDAIARPFLLEGREARIGASLGIARASDRAADDAAPGAAPRTARAAAARVLHLADLAMYRAKATGKGGWARYDEEMVAAPSSLLAG